MKLANNAHGRTCLDCWLDRSSTHACMFSEGSLARLHGRFLRGRPHAADPASCALAGFDHLLFYTRPPLGSDRSIYRLGRPQPGKVPYAIRE